MLDRPTLLTRLAVAKMAGLLLGLTAFVLMPIMVPEADGLFRWGVLLWYPTMGMVIAMLEELDARGELPCPMPWWTRGALVGAWLNFVATFLSFDMMAQFMVAAFGPGSFMSSPFWFVPAGALAGVLIAYLVMRFGGEGREIEDD